MERNEKMKMNINKAYILFLLSDYRLINALILIDIGLLDTTIMFDSVLIRDMLTGSHMVQGWFGLK